jgi:hypothetical protein
VDSFLVDCNRNSSTRVRKTHIWKHVGHSSPRQFEYWQADEDRIPGTTRGATAQDDLNFRRVLSMAPKDFVAVLQQRGILSKKT